MGRSSKQETREAMEIENNKLCKLREEPHLSGAYIRSLVKQLTSSRTTKDPEESVENGDAQNLANFGEQAVSDAAHGAQQPPSAPPPHKKQVRRRLHTTRPYQERLLNMAEARREIVTALKFHRASMRQAQEQQQQQQSPSFQPQPSSQPCYEEGKIVPRMCQKLNQFSNHVENLAYPSSFAYPPQPPTHPSPFTSWPISPISPLPPLESLNFTLPNQPLGLNLNFHDFDNLHTTLFHNGNVYTNTNPAPSLCSASSPSSSSSPSLSVVADEGPNSGRINGEVPSMATDALESGGGGGLHQVLDDEKMAEIRSIGEQHQMEWNDTMNLVTSAWWFQFLKDLDIGPEVKAEDDGYRPFDEVMEFPSWLSSGDTNCLQQHLDDCFSEDYFQDPALPCMDIEEIEGIDGEWLA